jgi:uncharacterized SAM-binding protein YcdF (DUF218 family)
VTPYGIAIFGARVTADGRASPALARRIGYALAAAREGEAAPILCSGAATGGAPSEAAVIARVLAEAGVSADRLVLDEESRDTLESAVATARFVRRGGLAGVVVCTDHFHMARTRMLLAALGVPSRPGPAPWGPGGAPTGYWLRMSLREAAAYPYDYAVVRWRRRELLAGL